MCNLPKPFRESGSVRRSIAAGFRAVSKKQKRQQQQQQQQEDVHGVDSRCGFENPASAGAVAEGDTAVGKGPADPAVTAAVDPQAALMASLGLPTAFANYNPRSGEEEGNWNNCSKIHHLRN